MDLAIAHAALIAAFEKEIYHFPEHTCCFCEHLHQRKSVSVIRLSENLKNSDVWLELKLYIQSNTPDVVAKVLYMYSYCKARKIECLHIVSSMACRLFPSLRTGCVRSTEQAAYPACQVLSDNRETGYIHC